MSARNIPSECRIASIAGMIRSSTSRGESGPDQVFGKDTCLTTDVGASHAQLPFRAKSRACSGSPLDRRFGTGYLDPIGLATVIADRTCTTMLVTSFKLKYVIYKIVYAFFQLGDVARVHPMRERSLRALQRTVDYIDRVMPDALGFEAPSEVLAFAIAAVKIDGYYLEFGVFTGGTIRFIARKIGRRIIHGFDSFQGLPEDSGGYKLGQLAFDTGGPVPEKPGHPRLHPGWF